MEDVGYDHQEDNVEGMGVACLARITVFDEKVDGAQDESSPWG